MSESIGIFKFYLSVVSSIILLLYIKVCFVKNCVSFDRALGMSVALLAAQRFRFALRVSESKDFVAEISDKRLLRGLDIRNIKCSQ